MWKWIVKVIFNMAGLLDGAENRLSDWKVGCLNVVYSTLDAYFQLPMWHLQILVLL